MAASFAARKPERVASMVLLAPAGLTRSTRFGELQTSYLRGGEGLEEQAQAWILGLLDGGQLVIPPDWKERTAKGELVPEAVRDWQTREHPGHAASVVAMFRDGGALDQHVEFAKAAKTDVKYLCIRGELDHLSTVQDLHDVGMRNVVVVPQVGHGIVRECVPKVSGLIEEFWKELEK
ncbi:valacyclovir hydrolase [Fusarium albosuccineum]|uniref:Valacyclovir hydrolase n=1 Tax=Fusarium albosuccineum TaxID=1237068 RepID=A0A8H4L3L9_9HYPO|nr:valacyclovir hydrolase [Fusarium albosuccineum]